MTFFKDHTNGFYLLGSAFTAGMLIGLPLAGVFAAGMDAVHFLEFPPLTRYVSHADFSWPVFILIAGIALILFGSLLTALLHARQKGKQGNGNKSVGLFPWWGWMGLSAVAIGWILAWNRFEWFSQFQRHTFPILWLGYVLTVNALCLRRSATCPLMENPVRFSALFALSACFWWFFEYLNRFVQNWYYIGAKEFNPIEYVFFASISFSTVLPAVFSTYRLLSTFDTVNTGLARFPIVKLSNPRWIALSLLLVAGFGLSLIGVFPDFLFPLLWVSPFLIVTALQLFFGRNHVFSSLRQGDWRIVILGPSAALICGFFWEMWNINSLSKWEYAIPFVHRFKLFEMPILGYAGYLPFGLECLMICQIIFGADLKQK